MYDASETMEMSMGGLGSGAARSTHIGNVEDVLALDIRALRRLGVIVPGECIIETLCWSIGGRNTFSVRLRADLSDIERGGTIIVTSTTPDGAINHHIAIEALPSAYGGHRCYFLCPLTLRRCEILYYAGGQFASRQAHRLSHATQNMTDLSRARRKAVKLRRRLQGTGVLSRPRGGNRIDMVYRLRDAEFEAKLLYLESLQSHACRSGSHWMPGKRS